MNERIKELIKQMDQAQIPTEGSGYTLYVSDLEYFAKLIVQECIELIDNKVTITAEQIREHFGVEG